MKALEALLTEKGLIDPAAIDAIVDIYETRVGPRNGARVVAKAWTDPEYRKRLLANATSAVAELGFAGPEGNHLVAVENTDRIHNLVVCTLCSCYPWPVLGLPPVWYKSFAYRSRAVSDPRGVLKDFGLELAPDVEVRVWDSSAEIRYLVIPQRPKGTEQMSEDALAAIRDARLDGRSGEGRGAAPMSAAALNKLIEAARLDADHVFSAPWEARAFAIALKLSEAGHFSWDEFRDRLIAEVGASDRIRARDGTSDQGEYYEHFLRALERLLEEKGIAP